MAEEHFNGRKGGRTNESRWPFLCKAAKLRERYGAYADRLAIYAPYAAPDDLWAGILSDLKQG